MIRASILIPILLTACVSQGDYDKVVEERDALQAKVEQLEKDIQSKKSRTTRSRKPKAPPVSKEKVAASLDALKIAAGTPLKAVFHTSMGDIACELYPEIAPATVENFVMLAEGGKEWKRPDGTMSKDPLYTGTKFHRVIDGFMIQGGDPEGTGRGGPGYTFEDEFDANYLFDKPGRLAMANRGPATNGSQFFITSATPRHLNMRHTVFGQCETDIVNKIMSVPKSGPQGSTPVEDVVLKNVEIIRG